MGVVVGKREIGLGDPNLAPPQGGNPAPDLRSILSKAQASVKIDDVDLGADIPDSLSGLVVTQAGEDFTDEELARIDRFVMRGRALVVVASAVNMAASDSKMMAALNTHRLDRLLAGYGIEMQSATVHDAGLQATIPVKLADGSASSLQLPAVLRLEHDEQAAPERQVLDNGFEAFVGRDVLAFPYTSPLILHPDRQPGAMLRAVARTTSQAVIDDSPSQNLALDGGWSPTGVEAPRVLAAVLDGDVRSAFGTGTSDRARVLVISSAQFLANPLARAGNPPPGAPVADGHDPLMKLGMFYAQIHLTETLLALIGVLDWMTAHDGHLVCAALLRRDGAN